MRSFKRPARRCRLVRLSRSLSPRCSRSRRCRYDDCQGTVLELSVRSPFTIAPSIIESYDTPINGFADAIERPLHFTAWSLVDCLSPLSFRGGVSSWQCEGCRARALSELLKTSTTGAQVSELPHRLFPRRALARSPSCSTARKRFPIPNRLMFEFVVLVGELLMSNKSL